MRFSALYYLLILYNKQLLMTLGDKIIYRLFQSEEDVLKICDFLQFLVNQHFTTVHMEYLLDISLI